MNSDDDFFTKHGRKNLFDDKAKAQQIEELRAAYVREGKALERKIDERKSEIGKLQSQIAELENKKGKQHADKLAAAKRELIKKERALDKLYDKRAAMPENQRLGEDAIRTARVWQEPDGRIVIHAKVAPPQPRLRYEGENRCGLESRPGFERAHGRGPGTGFESDCGIMYAPKDLNQQEQRLGIERFTQELYRDKPKNADLWMTNEIVPHEGTRNLKSNTYTASYTSKDGKQKSELFSIQLRDRPVANTRVGEFHIWRSPHHQGTGKAETQPLRDATRQQSTKQQAASNTKSQQAKTSPRPSASQGPKVATSGGGRKH